MQTALPELLAFYSKHHFWRQSTSIKALVHIICVYVDKKTNCFEIKLLEYGIEFIKSSSIPNWYILINTEDILIYSQYIKPIRYCRFASLYIYSSADIYPSLGRNYTLPNKKRCYSIWNISLTFSKIWWMLWKYSTMPFTINSSLSSKIELGYNTFYFIVLWSRPAHLNK